MCWITDKLINLEPERAIENIEIFKVCVIYNTIHSVITSAYRNFNYELNNVYSIKEEEVYPNLWTINEGFHSYSKKCVIYQSHPELIRIMYNDIVLDGFVQTLFSKYIKVVGYIPKGSKYFLNEHGEYVSSSICLTKIETI